jgi:glycerophosphoryl diester phosphodiesterase
MISSSRWLKPILLGHRGAKSYAPENTREAFDLALHHGCDGFEFDVRITGSGEAVCCHDPEWDGRVLSEHTAEDLGLLTFCAALETTGAFLDIDVKDADIVPRYAQELRALDPNRTVISSFLPKVVAEAMLFVPNIPAGLICRNSQQLSAFAHSGASFLIAHHTLVTRQLVKSVHAEEKRVFVWTVNDPRQMQHFAQLGVDAIISDDTLLLSQVCGSLARAANA